MRRAWIRCVAIIASIFSLTTNAQETSFTELGLSVIDIDGNSLMPSDREAILRTLQEGIIAESKHPALANIDIREEKGVEELRALLDRISNGTLVDLEAIPSEFYGIEGLSTIIALRTFALNEPVIMKGKIVDYGFAKDSEQFGSGHLAVQMTLGYYDAMDVLYKQEFLHWDVEIIRDGSVDGYEVRERQGDAASDPDNPFPNTVSFPPEATNPADLRSVWARGLDHKLFAKYNDIKIRNVYLKTRTVASPPDNDFVRLDDNDYRYQATPSSCIDIMFAGYPPPIELPPQIGYCLGRCDHPQIYNSK